MAKATTSPLVRQAQTAEDAGKLKEAELLLRQATQANPKDPAALARLVRLYIRKLKRADLAARLVPGLLRLAPRAALAHELAAETYFTLRDHDAALLHAEKTLQLGPRAPDGLYVAATVFQNTDRYDEAAACMETALSVRPDHLPSKLLLATAKRSAGRLAEAEAICRGIFAQYPESLPNFSIWSQTCKQTADDPMYLHLRDVLLPQLEAMGHPGLQRVLQILGKAENDIGAYEQAFGRFAKAKALEPASHDRGVNKRFVGTLIADTSRAEFFGAAGNQSEVPVLIVGMPRSGSTLLEQILSSHPAIGGIGESRLLRDLATENGFRSNDGRSLVNLISSMTPDKAAKLADIYLKNSTDKAPGSLRIVDKNLHNFELLGFFAKLFPKARILTALRDPMDTCVSCYMQPLSRFHSYTQDLTSLGQYYGDFRRLLDHWTHVVPNPVMPVPYEDMVADTEGMARRIIDFLGLEWDPACLAFQDNENRARTFSTWQVRQPIYQSSVSRWRRYDGLLGPLKAELAPFYPQGFDGPASDA